MKYTKVSLKDFKAMIDKIHKLEAYVEKLEKANKYLNEQIKDYNNVRVQSRDT